jgi:hypothetical protein
MDNMRLSPACHENCIDCIVGARATTLGKQGISGECSDVM